MSPRAPALTSAPDVLDFITSHTSEQLEEGTVREAIGMLIDDAPQRLPAGSEQNLNVLV